MKETLQSGCRNLLPKLSSPSVVQNTRGIQPTTQPATRIPISPLDLHQVPSQWRAWLQHSPPCLNWYQNNRVCASSNTQGIRFPLPGRVLLSPSATTLPIPTQLHHGHQRRKDFGHHQVLSPTLFNAPTIIQWWSPASSTQIHCSTLQSTTHIPISCHQRPTTTIDKVSRNLQRQHTKTNYCITFEGDKHSTITYK